MTSIRTIYDFIDAIQTDSEARRRMVAALNVADTDTQERVLASVDRLTHNVESLTHTVSDQAKNIDSLTHTVAEQSRNMAEQGRHIGSLIQNVDSLTSYGGRAGQAHW